MSRLILGLIVGALGWSSASCAREATDLIEHDRTLSPSDEEEDEDGEVQSEEKDSAKPGRTDARVSDASAPRVPVDAGARDDELPADEPADDQPDAAGPAAARPDAGAVAPTPSAPRDAGAATPAAPADEPEADPPAEPEPEDAGRRFPVPGSGSLGSGGGLDFPGIGRRGSADAGGGSSSPRGTLGDILRDRFGR